MKDCSAPDAPDAVLDDKKVVGATFRDTSEGPSSEAPPKEEVPPSEAPPREAHWAGSLGALATASGALPCSGSYCSEMSAPA